MNIRDTLSENQNLAHAQKRGCVPSKNPYWQEADQLAIYKSDRGLGTTEKQILLVEGCKNSK